MRYRVAQQVGKKTKMNSMEVVQIKPKIFLTGDAQFCIRGLQILRGYDDSESISYLLHQGSRHLKDGIRQELLTKLPKE